jgi:hypothetical protein
MMDYGEVRSANTNGAPTVAVISSIPRITPQQKIVIENMPHTARKSLRVEVGEA